MAVSAHRRSFVRTTTAAGAVATVSLAGSVAAVVAAFAGTGHEVMPSWIARTVTAVLATVLFEAAALAALVTTGGLAVLHRDDCEERGVPYRPVRPRERVSGPVRVALRRRLRPGARPRPGDLVEVRPLAEITATLDEHGCLDGLPFMPEMAAYCGHRLPVYRRVDKLWEYAHGSGLRRLRDAVLLQTLRCDGSAHGGCQASCHLIWKEAWLTWPGQRTTRAPRAPAGPAPDLAATTHVATPDGLRYVCQATRFREATEPLGFNSLGHYWRDVVGGNLRAGAVVVELGVRAFNIVQGRLHRPAWPVVRPLDSDTSPHRALHLRPGQLVRVRTKREIESTLNRSMKNRGLLFTSDLLADCGGSYRVAASIDRVINEATGELVALKTPSILLEGVQALGGPLLIPQNEYFFWREIWLDPVDDGAAGVSSPEATVRTVPTEAVDRPVPAAGAATAERADTVG